MRRVRKREIEEGKRSLREMMRRKGKRGKGVVRERKRGGMHDKSERKSQCAIDGGGRARTQKQREREGRQEGEYGRRELLTVHCLYEPPESRHTP